MKIKGTNRSFNQQIALAADALAQANSYSSARLFSKGPTGVFRLLKKQREDFDASRTKIFSVKVCEV